MKRTGKKTDIEKQYKEGEAGRSQFLARAKNYSLQTLPYLFHRGEKKIKQYQSYGAEATNHFSNKVTSTLFPITEPFFMLKANPDDIKEFQDMYGASGDLNAHLAQVVQVAMDKMVQLKGRHKLTTYQKHITVAGNCGLVITDVGFKVFALDSYVVKRDSYGDLFRGITLSHVYFRELSKDAQRQLRIKYPNRKKVDWEKEKLNLYTRYEIRGEHCYIDQSVEDIEVMEPMKVKKALNPFIAGRGIAIDGEDYGYGMLDDYSGAFHVLNFLSEARALGAATMMDVKFLVKAGCLTDIDQLNKSNTGTFHLGNPDDITAFQLEKFADTTLIKDVIAEYTQLVGRAFLMLQTQIRDSERTTKFEIQRVANELDTAAGGNYSLQQIDLQEPLANHLMDMVSEELLDNIKPVIVTGLEALGKARMIEKLLDYTEAMGLAANLPEPIQQMMDWEVYHHEISSNIGLAAPWIKTTTKAQQQEKAEEDAAAMETNTLADSMASSLGSQLGKNLAGSN